MKKSVIFLILMSTGVAGALAQSMLKTSLADRSIINVSIDGRYFNKSGTSVTVGDLPPGRHYVEIYATSQDRRGRAVQDVVFQGKVKTSAGLITLFVFDANSGQKDIQQQDMNSYVPPANNDNYNNGQMTPPIPQSTLTTDKMNMVKAKVDAKAADLQKMEILKESLKGETFTTDQVSTIMGWFIFESSKVDFAKWAYTSTVDKENFKNLENQFSYKESQDSLDKFLQDQK